MPTHASQGPDDGSDEPASERRWSERRPCAMSVTLEADGESWEGTAQNLSLEGVFVALDRLPHPHVTRLEATVIDPGQRRHIATVLEVAHRRAQGIGFRLSLDGSEFGAWRDLWRDAAGEGDEVGERAAGAESR
jgi:hypothetical protein